MSFLKAATCARNRWEVASGLIVRTAKNGLRVLSANAAPKEGKGGKGGNAGNAGNAGSDGGKEAATANVDSFKIQDCNRLIIWTHWENMPDKKIASVDIVLTKDSNGGVEWFEIPSDPDHPIPSLGTAIFTPKASSLLGDFGDSIFEVTEMRFYDKRGNTIETFFTGGTPPLTGITGPKTAVCDKD